MRGFIDIAKYIKRRMFMNGLVLLIIGIALLLAGYVFYGKYLCEQWGVGKDDKETPAHRMEDGMDYVPAKAPVLMGHHFSSIAGAGPITGPISAIGFGFGWLACVLWIIIGGIFFGGVHDFGALIASLIRSSITFLSIVYRPELFFNIVTNVLV